MLACYVAANLWKKSFISGDVLEKNVICITFGQPLIAIPYVEEAIKDFPQLEATIHAVYDKDDFFPRVLHYFAVGCQHYFNSSQTMKTLSRSTTESLLMAYTMVKRSSFGIDVNNVFMLVQNFSSAFAYKFLQCLAVIQKVGNIV